MAAAWRIRGSDRGVGGEVTGPPKTSDNSSLPSKRQTANGDTGRYDGRCPPHGGVMVPELQCLEPGTPFSVNILELAIYLRLTYTISYQRAEPIVPKRVHPAGRARRWCSFTSTATAAYRCGGRSARWPAQHLGVRSLSRPAATRDLWRICLAHQLSNIARLTRRESVWLSPRESITAGASVPQAG
jgi:hypothetical protein